MSKFCIGCGERLPAEALFCPECGKAAVFSEKILSENVENERTESDEILNENGEKIVTRGDAGYSDTDFFPFSVVIIGDPIRSIFCLTVKILLRASRRRFFLSLINQVECLHILPHRLRRIFLRPVLCRRISVRILKLFCRGRKKRFPGKKHCRQESFFS